MGTRTPAPAPPVAAARVLARVSASGRSAPHPGPGAPAAPSPRVRGQGSRNQRSSNETSQEPPRDAMAGQERASPAGRLENDTIDSPEGRIIRLPPGDDRRVERPPPHGRQSMAAARNPLELIVSGRRSGTGWCRTRVAHLPRFDCWTATRCSRFPTAAGLPAPGRPSCGSMPSSPHPVLTDAWQEALVTACAHDFGRRQPPAVCWMSSIRQRSETRHEHPYRTGAGRGTRSR
jgi:hypothetical protein